MDASINAIANVLIDMRRDAYALAASPSDEGYDELKTKYDVVFGGERFNVVYGNDLLHCLRTKYSMDIEMDFLNAALPDVCKSISAKCIPMQDLNDIGTESQGMLHAYSILL